MKGMEFVVGMRVEGMKGDKPGGAKGGCLGVMTAKVFVESSKEDVVGREAGREGCLTLLEWWWGV